jgi:cytochrome c553
MKVLTVLIGAAMVATPVLAQNATRGAQLYEDTAKVTGKPVGACIACHAETGTLREMLRNRRGRCDDAAALARWLEAVIAGAQPGAANAKAQYRGVLKPKDLRDLAAYIACTKQAAANDPRRIAAASE